MQPIEVRHADAAEDAVGAVDAVGGRAAGRGRKLLAELLLRRLLNIIYIVVGVDDVVEVVVVVVEAAGAILVVTVFIIFALEVWIIPLAGRKKSILLLLLECSLVH